MNTNIKKFETKLLRNGYSSQGAISALTCMVLTSKVLNQELKPSNSIIISSSLQKKTDITSNMD